MCHFREGKNWVHGTLKLIKKEERNQLTNTPNTHTTIVLLD
jgi:hypothetical protein